MVSGRKRRVEYNVNGYKYIVECSSKYLVPYSKAQHMHKFMLHQDSIRGTTHRNRSQDQGREWSQFANS